MENEGSGGGRAGRFAAYLADLASVLGDARRYAAMVSYCTGLLLPSERKSVEPMAALTAPMRTAAQHQSLLHFVGQGDWSDFGVDRRRHGVSEKGHALGRRCTAILRTTGQAGQLSGRSFAFDRQRSGQFAGRVSIVLTAILGQ